MSRPATRVLALLEVLQDRGLVSADELAGRLAVDTRSVRRYATALREMGIPVESIRGRYGGYRLARGYRTPPLMLSDDEAVAVAVALAAAGDRESATEPSPTDRALIKLNRVLPTALRERVKVLATATAVLPDARLPITPEPELVLTLAAAVRARRRLRIDHTRPDGSHTTREVDPYGLVVHLRRWYLVGHDYLRDDLRTYRVDRIAGATDLPNSFTPPAGFDPVQHVRQTLTHDAWTHRTVVWLDTDAETARRRLPTIAGELRPGDGGVWLTSGAENLAGMARMLIAMPWRFSVSEPTELAAAVRAHVTALAQEHL